jgi:hypothetical protein
MGKRLNLAEREHLTFALKRLADLTTGKYQGTRKPRPREDYLTTNEQNTMMFAALDLLSVALSDHEIAVPSITRFIRQLHLQRPPKATSRTKKWRTYRKLIIENIRARYASKYVDWRTSK